MFIPGDANRDGLALEPNPMAYACVAQLVSKILFIEFEALFDRCVHVDFEQDIDAATQIEPEAHGPQSEIADPVGEFGRQCQRNARVPADSIAQSFARHLLLFDGVELEHDPAVLNIRFLG